MDLAGRAGGWQSPGPALLCQLAAFAARMKARILTVAPW